VLIAFCAAGAWFWQGQVSREFHYFQGFRAMRAGALPQAVDSLKKAWEANPREVNCNYEYANAYVRSGELEKGVWAYGEALKSNAGYDEIYFNLAIVLKRLGRTQEALKYLQLSSVINPLNPTTWHAIAEVYVSSPDKAAVAARAVADFTAAVRILPGDAALWNTLGYFYTLLRDFKGARAAYANGVKAEPLNPMLAENLVGVSRQLGLKNDPDVEWLESYRRLERASSSPSINSSDLKAADALAAVEPRSPKAVLLRAKLYFRADRLAEAEASLQELLKADDTDNQARYGLAVIYEKQGNRDLARLQWQRFLLYDPGNKGVQDRLNALR